MPYVPKVHPPGRFCPECVSQDCEHTRAMRNTKLLTVRMVQILRLMGECLPHKEIGYRLGIGEHSVNLHVLTFIMPRLGVGNRMEAVRYAWEHAEQLRAPVGPDVYMYPVGV